NTVRPAAMENWGGSLSMRGYLAREAGQITRQALSGYTDPIAWRRLIPERRRQYMEMMGLDELAPFDQRPPLNVTVTGVVERPKYRIEKLYYESVPKLFVTANLYLPNSLTSPAPGVLYVCGHVEKQKIHYQAHPRRFAELGFVCLLIETLLADETRGYHHGPYQEGWFHWYSRGYTPAGIEMLNGIRGLDLLVQRPEVDPKRLGVTGISGGGTTSWWIAAGDERVKASSPVCGTSTLASYVYDRTIDSNCDCMWWINYYRWDLADVGALIAPRPLLIVDSNRDEHFTLASMRELHRQLKRFYTLLAAPENLARLEVPGAHGYSPLSRTAVFSWFIKHLQGRNISPEEVGDIDDRAQERESEEALRVYVNGPPPGNRAPTIQDDFIKLPQPPHIGNVDELKKARGFAITRLLQKSFAAFPPTPPPLRVHIEHEYEARGTKGALFHFDPEEGWRLRGILHVSNSVSKPVPVVVGLRSPREKFERNDWRGGATDEFLRPIQAPWAKVSIELRGTGESVWGEALEWHLRRASAWTGRPLASMWVYDTLRALACVRQLPQVDGQHIALAARGEMTAVALYAALLDGQVKTVFLENPPATQNTPSPPDGRRAALEMLGCLRVTDLPQVAGLLYPAELVFVGECPSTYDWAQELYQRLGAAGRFQRVSQLADWRPSSS
ncbi:MAG: prolyl oligopeptidase family serine peptidase, partial [Acidobacteria bacterium]|nr:prolyl oligopeptidase family serine peptidase [Acidobacteriota bacterium]